jgi:D-cysteine desulfhydrase
VEELPRLGAALGVGRLYVKRDDLSGEAYGGNKVRKLEFLLAEAVRAGAKEVMTFGAAGSNHALATAVYAGQAGLRSISLLRPQPNARYVRKNLLLSRAVGAELHYYQDEESLRRGVEDLQRLHTEISGASPLGTVGFVNAAFELREQVHAGFLPEPELLYVTLGSMGTATGLLLGLRAAGLRSRMNAVRVVAECIANRDAARDLFHRTNRLLHDSDPSFPLLDFPEEQCIIRDDFFGEKYALFTREGMEAVRRMQEAEGISLDGTYTGKTFAALMHDAGQGNLRNRTVLFWDTLNSRDFSEHIRNVDYHELPEELHGYFEEDVQPLDREESH